MPSASEFLISPDANLTIGGVNVAEGCPPGGLNNVVRYLAAAARDSYDRIPAAGTYLPLTGGTLTGQLLRQSSGGHLYHANSAQAEGKVYIVPEGTARPTPAEGVVVFYYA